MTIYTATSPFYFSRSGHIAFYSSSLRYTGNDGAFWSGVSSTSTPDAYYFLLNDTVTYSSGSISRWFGFSVQKVYLVGFFKKAS